MVLANYLSPLYLLCYPRMRLHPLWAMNGSSADGGSQGFAHYFFLCNTAFTIDPDWHWYQLGIPFHHKDGCREQDAYLLPLFTTHLPLLETLSSAALTDHFLYCLHLHQADVQFSWVTSLDLEVSFHFVFLSLCFYWNHLNILDWFRLSN